MKIIDCEQRTPEWMAARCGKVTGSCAPALIAVRKRGTGELAIRRDLRQRMVVEILTGVPLEDMPYKGKDLQHGIDTEAEAVIAYEVATGDIVSRVGFVEHDELAAGCSPDGYVGDWEGILECKCPASATHLEYIRANAIPEEYYGQLLHALWLTGAQWADFVSFDPRYQDPSLRLFCKRLHRANVDLVAYELAVRLFLDEVQAELNAVRGLHIETAVA